MTRNNDDALPVWVSVVIISMSLLFGTVMLIWAIVLS